MLEYAKWYIAMFTRQLSILKGLVNWDDARSRFSFFRTINLFIKEWNKQNEEWNEQNKEWNKQIENPSPNLLVVFTPDEIEMILKLAVEDLAGDYEDRLGFIEFVAATGFRDAQRTKGRPITNRVTPLHRLFHSTAPGDRNRMASALFRIYDRINPNCAETGYLEDPTALSLTHFHVACCISDGYELVQRFLDGGQDPNVATIDGVTPLSLALTLRNVKMVELLLRRGAVPRVQAGEIPFSALHHLCKCCGDDHELARKLFDICAEIGTPLEIDARDPVGNTPLHVALSFGCHKEFLGLLLKKGANPNATNNAGSTPLHVICQKDHVHGLLQSFFNLVRENGRFVFIDALDSMGRTPLHSALRAGNHRAAAFLLQNHANPNSSDYEGLTPQGLIQQYHASLEVYLQVMLKRELNQKDWAENVA